MERFAKRLGAFILEQLVAQRWLTGYRTYLAGTACLAAGIVFFVDVGLAEHYDSGEAIAGCVAFAIGYKLIGDRGLKDTIVPRPPAGVHVG